MRRRARLLLVLTVAVLPGIAGCVSDNGGGAPDFDGALPDEDSGQPNPGCFGTTGITCVDASTFDATIPDAGRDSTASDAGEVDANVPDSTLADTSVLDANQPDTSELDTSAPDSNEPDTSVADSSDGSLPVDAGSDAVIVDTGIDAAVADAGPPQCAVDVEGNYYIRASGTVAYYNGTTYEVTIGSTGVPLSPVSQVFSEPYSACALRSSDSTVWCWSTFATNNNSDGQLGNGTLTDVNTTFQATQVEISAVDGGATVYLDQVTSLPTGSTAAAGGISFAGLCAIRTDKSLWCWGPATQGDLWKSTTGSNNDLAFATQMMVTADAGVDGGAAFMDVDQVSMGGRHACYLSAGNVYCWGDNTSGELGTGDTTDQVNPFQVTSGIPNGSIASVTAGEDQSCVFSGGAVYCWGADTYSTNGNPFVAHSTCNLNPCQPLPVQVQLGLPDGGSNAAPLTGMVLLYGGDAFSCALDALGNAYCWGAANGTPTLAQEAELFINPGNAALGTPTGPIAKITSISEGFEGPPTALRYLTTSGALVNGDVVVPQVCP